MDVEHPPKAHVQKKVRFPAGAAVRLWWKLQQVSPVRKKQIVEAMALEHGTPWFSSLLLDHREVSSLPPLHALHHDVWLWLVAKVAQSDGTQQRWTEISFIT